MELSIILMTPSYVIKGICLKQWFEELEVKVNKGLVHFDYGHV
ncbi:hypothetical protein [Abyssisolibacter fermentans]|nr:hypothetical protein [Abyssisolibacter fermentans]